MKIVVGLGNPGLLYKNTRHNIGFMFVEEMAKYYEGKWKLNKEMKLEACELIVGTEKVVLIKPLTYMNLSGNAVSSIMNFYKVSVSDLLVIYDDLDFAVGSFRIKPAGSSGGHKGMKSLIEHLGTQEIKRIRIGILSALKSQDTRVDYVLGKFSKAEKNLIEDLKENAPHWLSDFTIMNFEDFMSKYNKKNGS